MKKQSPKEMPPLDASLFWEVVNVGIRAGQEDSSAADDADNASSSPWHRAGVAIRAQLGEDSSQFEPAMTRFTALMDLYGDGTIEAWLRDSPDDEGCWDMHPAIIDVAARMRMSRNGRFAPNKFIERVCAHAKEWYGDYGDWTG